MTAAGSCSAKKASRSSRPHLKPTEYSTTGPKPSCSSAWLSIAAISSLLSITATTGCITARLRSGRPLPHHDNVTTGCPTSPVGGIGPLAGLLRARDAASYSPAHHDTELRRERPAARRAIPRLSGHALAGRTARGGQPPHARVRADGARRAPCLARRALPPRAHRP